ncbi:hypothetical protein LAG90_18200 [Marinilongibacter aquaticus]|uniref:hypothetical protein n=1 Tax=Marinilongibacter aquaticus TaxID=2975157 RepID=UPI0021BDE73F|nr:hypothetical protein [Marinilongibacter aquaticus]UBM58735.1 hypothetical protein LAG90_18200 [Marinilongibacter aquaticus]
MTKYTYYGMVLVYLLSVSCQKDGPMVEEKPEAEYMERGFVVSSINESTNGYTYYAGYFDDLLAGTSVDMTTTTTYNYLYTRAAWENFVFGTSISGDATLAKMAVDKEGRLTEVASFPLLNVLNGMTIINDELAVYSVWNTDRTLEMFNPRTMEKLGEIDMSHGFKIEGNRNFYNGMIYRSQDNRLFVTLHTDDTDTGSFYDSDKVYVEVVNLDTKTWEKTIVFEGASYPVSRGNEYPIVDESGNVYIFTQGSYGLDGQLGPAAAAYSRPKILKIPAGSTEFDANYAFNPVNVLGQQNLLVQLMLGGIYDSNGIAYSCISAASESARILELVQKYGSGQATEAEYLELRNAIFYSENQRWVKLDLNAQSVSVIDGIPLTAGFAYPNAYKYDGRFYFEYNTSSSNGSTGYYEYDPGTASARKFVSLTNGGIATELIKLNP